MQFSIKTPLCMQYFHERYNDIIMILKLKFIKKINQWNCWGLINKPNSERQNQYNSLSLNMAAHMASRGLRMRSFYYGKITNKITTIQTKPYSVKTIYNIHKGFLHYWPC